MLAQHQGLLCFSLCTHSVQAAVGRRLGGDTAGTSAGQSDIPHHVTSCSAAKLGRVFPSSHCSSIDLLVAGDCICINCFLLPFCFVFLFSSLHLLNCLNCNPGGFFLVLPSIFSPPSSCKGVSEQLGGSLVAVWGQPTTRREAKPHKALEKGMEK